MTFWNVNGNWNIFQAKRSTKWEQLALVKGILNCIIQAIWSHGAPFLSGDSCEGPGFLHASSSFSSTTLNLAGHSTSKLSIILNGPKSHFWDGNNLKRLKILIFQSDIFASK